MKKNGIASLPSVARNDRRAETASLPLRPFWPGWVSAILIIVLGCVVYANSLGGKFIFDDARLVENNNYIKKWSNLSKVLTEDIGAGAGSTYNYYNFYRPIQMITYMVDYTLWGLDPLGFHLTSMLLHIAAAIALYVFLTLLFSDKRVSFLAAALFVVHPIHTEAVSYIAGRADMLVALFLLVFLIYYIKCVSTDNLVYYAIALTSFILACMSKEYSLIALPIIFIYHYVFGKKPKAIYIGGIGLITIIYIFLRATVFNFPTFNKAGGGPFFERVPGFFVAMAQYMRLLFLPFDLRMEYGSFTFSFLDPRCLGGILVVAFLIWSIMKARENKPVLFSLLWFLIMIFPVSNLYPINAYMSEHWLYMPSMGIFFLASYGLFKLYDKRNMRIPVMATMICLLCFYSYLTIMQNAYWKDSITFYERTLKFNPRSDRIASNLATEYMVRGEYDRAIALFKKTADTSTDPAGLYNNLGIAYSTIKNEKEAIKAYKKAIETNPAFAEAYNNLGVSYAQTGDKERAREAFSKAIEINPNYAEAYNNLGSETTDQNAAIEAYEKALEIRPNYASACYNLSAAYKAAGRIEDAERMYRRAQAMTKPAE